MAETSALADKAIAIAAGAHVVGASFMGTAAALALADGTVIIAGDGGEQRVVAHADGAVLVSAATPSRIVTGGDDGRIVEIRADASVRTLADEKGKWIDAIAVRDDGAVAWSAGKQVRARDGKGEIKSFSAPSSVRGVAFMPKGYRVALAHYNGAMLWFPNTVGDPTVLGWRGSHLDIIVSPDGNFVVTSMQENSLHGWRVADHRDMRMSGYPSKTRSFSWSHDGRWLATSGAEACIVWPFQTKDGPMGKSPRECGVRPAKVTRVAFHPKALVVAIGYEDGWVLLCRLGDGAEIPLRARDLVETSPISALAWNADGNRVVWGSEGGSAGIASLPPS